MKEGKEPLRTFGDLKQFLEKPAAEKKQSIPEPQADRVTDPQDGQPAAE
jgi:hypothetical protein